MKLYYNSKLDWWGCDPHKDDLIDDSTSCKVYVFLKEDKPSNSVYLLNEVRDNPYWEEVKTTPANKTYSKDYIEMVNKRLIEAEKRGLYDEFTVTDAEIMADLENRVDELSNKLEILLKFESDLLTLVENHTKFALHNVSGSCECGKYRYCCRKIQSNPYGKMWVETHDHLNCGKVQKQILDMKEWLGNNYR